MLSIIVEGFDGAGKSTLCEKLARHYGTMINHAGPPALNNDHAINCCIQQLAAIDSGLVLDRVTPISRVCYQQDISDYHRILLHTYLTRMVTSSVVIWCRPEEYVHVQKGHDSDDHFHDITVRQNLIVKNYEQLMPAVFDVMFDYKLKSFESLIEELESNYAIR